MSAGFKRTRVERFAPPSATVGGEASETRYWSKLKPSFSCDFHSPVSSVAFAPGEARGADGAPVYRLCVVAGLDVHVLSIGASRGSEWRAPNRKSVGRFKAVAQSACWRSDGRLIAVGDAEGAVHLVDAASGATLRRLVKGHGAGRAARAACWGADGTACCSAGGDGTLVLWDVTTGTGVARVEAAHGDAATAVCHKEGSLFASCGYDGLVKLWDLRSGAARAARVWDHGTRCEHLLAVPGGNVLASCGGHDVALWDALDDTRPLHRFKDAHAKSATCLALDGTMTKLLSGGLDGLVKVHSLGDHATVARPARYAAPVMSLAIAGGAEPRLQNRVLCVGTNAGVLDGRARDVSIKRDDRKQTLKPPPGTFRHFNRGKAFTPGLGGGASEPLVVLGASLDDDKIKRRKGPKLAPHDDALRTFRYRDALDEALKTRDPTVVVAVLDDLDRRGGRDAALANRTEKALEPVLSFLAAHVALPRYAAKLVPVVDALLDAHGADLGAHPALDELFAKIHSRASDEVANMTALLGLSGALDALLAANQYKA